MKTIALEGTLRGDLGKKSTKALRNEGAVPCVIYGGENNIHFSANKQNFRDLIYTNEFKTATITVDGAVYSAIVKDIQFHPVSDAIQHVDFLELVKGKSIKTEIPVRLVGSPEGVKVGGNLMQKVRKLKVMVTPELLSSTIDVNVEHLELGKSIRIRDIQVAEGVQIMSSGTTPVASIEIPRALRSAQSGGEGEGEEEEV